MNMRVNQAGNQEISCSIDDFHIIGSCHRQTVCDLMNCIACDQDIFNALIFRIKYMNILNQ